MKKKLEKKLSLTKLTVSNLNLDEVKGGRLDDSLGCGNNSGFVVDGGCAAHTLYYWECAGTYLYCYVSVYAC